MLLWLIPCFSGVQISHRAAGRSRAWWAACNTPGLQIQGWDLTSYFICSRTHQTQRAGRGNCCSQELQTFPWEEGCHTVGTITGAASESDSCPSSSDLTHSLEHCLLQALCPIAIASEGCREFLQWEFSPSHAPAEQHNHHVLPS